MPARDGHASRNSISPRRSAALLLSHGKKCPREPERRVRLFGILLRDRECAVLGRHRQPGLPVENPRLGVVCVPWHWRAAPVAALVQRVVEIADGILELIAAEIGFGQSEFFTLIEQRCSPQRDRAARASASPSAAARPCRRSASPCASRRDWRTRRHGQCPGCRASIAKCVRMKSGASVGLAAAERCSRNADPYPAPRTQPQRSGSSENSPITKRSRKIFDCAPDLVQDLNVFRQVAVMKVILQVRRMRPVG